MVKILTKSDLVCWLEQLAHTFEINRELLTELDAAIGDADHGVNSARGFAAVKSRLQDVATHDIGTILQTTSLTLALKMGGASGLLYANFFKNAAETAGTKEALSLAEWTEMFESGINGIYQRGRAEIGDKTMIDAWMPAYRALQIANAEQREIQTALCQCADAANQGMLATVELRANKGRASYLGDRSIGHQDPGATSTYLILSSLCDVVSRN